MNEIIETDYQDNYEWDTKRANGLHNIAVKGLAASAAALATIQDEGLYQNLGFETMEEYSENMLPHSYRTTQRLIAVGRNLLSVSPNLLLNKGFLQITSGTQLNETTIVSSEIPEDKIDLIGVRKLMVLTRLPETDFADLMNGRRIMTGSGELLDIEKAIGLTERELKEMFEAAPENTDPEAVRQQADKTLNNYAMVLEKPLALLKLEIDRIYKKQPALQNRLYNLKLKISNLETEVKEIVSNLKGGANA
ncbi:MAG: hypothetical protein HUU43_14150 [Ignavibacteriaceae bacterium]|nr:hypothetical protein [Ignavibacteriaceae bacterium]